MLLRRPLSKDDSPELFEAVGATELPGVVLHDDGDFSVAEHRFKQSDATILAAIFPPWVVSKAQGDGEDLLLASLSNGAKHCIRYRDGKWVRRLYWQPLQAAVQFDVLLFLPGRVHVLPTLHQIGSGDGITVKVETPAGTLLVEEGQDTNGFLCVRLPSGEERRYAQREHRWFEIVSSQVDAHAPSEEIALPSPPAFDTSVARNGKCWVLPDDPRFLVRPGTTRALVAAVDHEHIAFGNGGELLVQNRAFLSGPTLELHFRTVVIRRQQDLVQIDVTEPGGESKWRSDLFRFGVSGWERLVSADEELDFWNKYGNVIAYAVIPAFLLTAAVAVLSILFDLFPWLERIVFFFVP